MLEYPGFLNIAFYEIQPQCFHSENCLVVNINLRNFLLLEMAKRKSQFTDEVNAKHPCFPKGRNESEAECLVCKPGTYISVSYKGIADLKSHVSSNKHCKAGSGASSSSKVTNYFAQCENFRCLRFVLYLSKATVTMCFGYIQNL